jgi:hypothetical protein
MLNNSSPNRDVYEAMLENMAERHKSHNILRHMRFACWTTKATDTQSEYVTLIAFSRQKRLRESP